MARFEELEAFVKVVEQGTFSAAAQALGVSKSYMSKQIAKLEDRLGAQLMHRTTRSMTLTDVGAAFYDRAVRIMGDLEEAERSVQALHVEPRGTLRISVPMSFGVRYLTPAMNQFMVAYPDIEIDATFSDRLVDLVDEGYDMAIRIGELKDSSMVARRLAPMYMSLCASPSYLEAHGAPEHPDDLRQHACLLYTLQSSWPTWRFRSGEQEVSVKVDGPLRTNNGDALMEAARAGLGCSILPHFFLCEALQDGSLQRILTDWECGATAIWAVYPQNRHLSTKVRRFVDFLVEAFHDPPWESIK